MGVSAPRPRTGGVILLVDDDPIIGELVSATLGAAGFTVFVVEHGDDAVDQVWLRNPALIILDLNLPGRPGMLILDDLRTSPAFSELPVIMLTGRRSEWNEVIARRHGADCYLRKPIAPADLVVAVSRLLALAPPRGRDAGGRP